VGLAPVTGIAVVGEGGIDPTLHQLLARAGDGTQRRRVLAAAPDLVGFEASACGRIRAFNACLARTLPFWISALNSACSPALSLTIYFFKAGCFAVTAHLRVAGDIDSDVIRKTNTETHQYHSHPVET
jgi:hypothetical protein